MKSSETLYIGGDIQIDMNGNYTHIFGGGYSEFKPEVNNADSIKYYYYTKDHLGNIRNVLTQNESGTMTELQHTSYYPFGGIIADLSTGRDVQNRMYNGKEQDFSNNLYWLDYGARQYDPTRGQFTTPDPMSESTYNLHIYMYANNNPTCFIDIFGLKGIPANQVDWSNFDVNEDWVDLEEVSVTASKPTSAPNYTSENTALMTVENTLNTVSSVTDGIREYIEPNVNRIAPYVFTNAKTGEIVNSVTPMVKLPRIDFEVRFTTAKNIKNGAKGLTKGSAAVATGIEAYQILHSGKLKTSDALNILVSGFSCFPTYGWAIGGIYLTADYICKGITGSDIGTNIDNFIINHTSSTDAVLFKFKPLW